MSASLEPPLRASAPPDAAPTPDVRIHRAPGAIARRIGSKLVVIVLPQLAAYTLDEAGAQVWDRADGRTLADLVRDIGASEQRSDAEIRPAILAFVDELERAGAFRIEPR
jgi:hypothetical protein